MAVSTTAQGKANISFTIIENKLNQSEAASLDFSVNLPHGTGDGKVNYGVYATGSLNGANSYTQSIDLTAVSKEFIDLNDTVQFSKIYGILFKNISTGNGTEYNFYVAASGANMFSKPFSNTTGRALLVKDGIYQYFDPNTGTAVSPTHKILTLKKPGTATPNSIDWAMCIIGVTG